MRKRQYDPCQPQRLQQHDVCIFCTFEARAKTQCQNADMLTQHFYFQLEM